MRAEFPLLVLFAALGMGMMVSAGDLLTLYIGLELNSLASYVLAAFLRTDDRSAESGLKYFVLGSLASGILLFGMSLTYGFTGTTSFEGIRLALSGSLSTGATFGIVFVLAGLAFKISAAPFHMWTPDVYEGAPTPVTTFFATAPKAAALALLMRVASKRLARSRGVAADRDLRVAAVDRDRRAGRDRAGEHQAPDGLFLDQQRRLHADRPCGGDAQGASAMLVYLAIYVAMSIAGFVAILLLRDENGDAVEAISDLAGLSKTRPMLALALAAVMFSLAGIPPLFGFWGKFVVFQAAVQANLVARGHRHRSQRDRRVLLPQGRQGHVLRRGSGPVKGEIDLAHGVLLAASALFISPLGYLLTKWIGTLADNAATALFHVA
jgi:NADH-quinone oxidoreductase subunit N